MRSGLVSNVTHHDIITCGITTSVIYDAASGVAASPVAASGAASRAAFRVTVSV